MTISLFYVLAFFWLVDVDSVEKGRVDMSIFCWHIREAKTACMKRWTSHGVDNDIIYVLLSFFWLGKVDLLASSVDGCHGRCSLLPVSFHRYVVFVRVCALR